MTWDPDTQPAKCANGDGNPITGETTVDVVDIAIDDDGYSWITLLLCAQCLEANP